MSGEPVVFVMGPTGAGKTATVFALATLLPIEVISVDAAQIYRGLDIGTAKPSLAERRQLPHKLIDIRGVADSYSAAAFCRDARLAIEESVRRGRLPVLVGGSSFYFRALEYGLPETPPAQAAVRALLSTRIEREGLAALYRELEERDPRRAASIAPTDPQRIMRALEVAMAVGTVPPAPTRISLPNPIIKFGLSPGDRADLHVRIAQRFKRMLARGLIEEGLWLYSQGLAPSSPSLRLVGYRQVGEYLRGKIQYTELLEQGIAATRQLAKRQLTWLRADSAVKWVDSGRVAAETCAKIMQESIEKKRSDPFGANHVSQS